MLRGKHILLGITGSIAAYKAATLVRALVKEGAEVKVIMTEMAKQFITPLTMATVSKNPILVEFYNPENGDWNSHISLGMWANLYLIAPASANTIAKMATGIADNLLLTTYLSSRCPVMIAPAMDVDMYNHKVTQSNIEKLRGDGVIIVEPGSGELASGLEGKGRMEEPDVIAGIINDHFCEKTFTGKRVMITAGPTVEKIDPVRYISNHSTGKMGYALAEEFARRGASVTLISGPVNISTRSHSLKVINVCSAEEMYRESMKIYEAGTDIAVFAAAVSDFTPSVTESSKIKKTGSTLAISLLPTKDIAHEVGKVKRDGVFHVGFALETDNERDNAISKLSLKRFDAIVLNSLNDPGAGFGSDTNKVTIISQSGEITEYKLKDKKEVASDIVNYVENNFVC